MANVALIVEFIFVFLFVCWVLSKGGNDDEHHD